MPDAVVGDAVLLVVVGADLVGASATLHLAPAGRRELLLLALTFDLEQAAPQDPHRLVLVLQLALLVLAGDHEARRLVRDPDRRVGRVHRLTAGAARPVDVDLEIVGVDGHVDLLGLGKHGDRGRAGVHPALALGGGDPLHPMGSGFVLEARPRVGALHHERDLAHTAHVGQLAAEHLDLPAVEVGVALVHVEQVGGPEVALLAAFTSTDLHDHVLAVARILRHEELAQLGVERGELRVLRRDLAVEVVAHVGVGLARQHLLRLGELVLRWCGRCDTRRRRASARPGVAPRPRPRSGRRTRRAPTTATRASPARSRGRPSVRTWAQGYRRTPSAIWRHNCAPEHTILTPKRLGGRQAMRPGRGAKPVPMTASASTPSQSCTTVAYKERKSVV